MLSFSTKFVTSSSLTDQEGMIGAYLDYWPVSLSWGS